MALSDYKFCEANAEVKSVQNAGSFSVLVGGKIACSVATGGAHYFSSELQAEVFGRQLTRGYNSGTYLSEDIYNFIRTNDKETA